MGDPTRWWRVFGPAAGEGRRRQSRRFPHQIRVSARCDSWPEFLELVTGDVSAGGLFVATERDAEVGETIELRLALPDGSELPLRGRVVNTADDAGIGVQLEEPSGEDATRFAELLATAREHQPRPEVPDREVAAPASAEGAEPLRLSAVHRALGAELLELIDPDEITGEFDLAELDVTIWEPPVPEAAPPSITPRRSGRSGPIIGIDLGSTQTAVSIVAGDRVRLIDERDTSPATDAPVFESEPARTPRRRLEDPDDTAAIELCAKVLERARLAAERDLGEDVGRAVLSVPIHFGEVAVDRLREAAGRAGLEVEAVIDEPSAVVLANRFEPDFGGIVGVYDLGGGAFDFSVVDASRGDPEVLATGGDHELGGDAFDRILAESAAQQFARNRRVDLRQQPVEWRALIAACERAKRALTRSEVAAIVVEDVIRNAAGPVDLRFTVTRALFERACSHLISRSLETCREVLSHLDRESDPLDAVVLSGGATYIPAVRQRLARALKAPLRTAVPAEFAVCLGAGIHAAYLSGRTTGGT